MCSLIFGFIFDPAMALTKHRLASLARDKCSSVPVHAQDDTRPGELPHSRVSTTKKAADESAATGKILA